MEETPFVFVSSLEDRQKLFEKGFTIEKLVFVTEDVLAKLELTPFTITEILMFISSAGVSKQTFSEKSTKLKPVDIPPLETKNIRSWILYFSRILVAENLEAEWYRLLLRSCEPVDAQRVMTAVEEGKLDAKGSWSDNRFLLDDLFSPSLSRGQLLCEVFETKPRPGETLQEFILRYRTKMFSAKDIPEWFFAELFILSMPENIRHELLLSGKNKFDSFKEVEQLAERFFSDQPSHPILQNFHEKS